MNDDLSKMTQAQKDALAARALKAQEKARQRSEAYRDRKKGAGMVQVSVWVPGDHADQLRRFFRNQVEKFMTEIQASKKSPPRDQAGAGQSAGVGAAKTPQNPAASQPAQTKPGQ